MAVQLHLPQVCVSGVLADSPGELLMEVEFTVRRLRCAHRGFKCHWFHDGRANKVRDLQVLGRRVRPVRQRRRMVCADCDSRFLEDRLALEDALTARRERRLDAVAGRRAAVSMSRLHADAELVGRLAADGFEGPSLDRFVGVLVEFG